MHSQKKNKWFAFLALALVVAFMMTGCGKGVSSEPSSDFSEKVASQDETPVVRGIMTKDDYYDLHWKQGLKERIFDGHYRSQLPDEEKLIFDALYQHIIVEGRTDDLVIDFSSVDTPIGEEAMRYIWTSKGTRDGKSFVDENEDGLANTAFCAFRDDCPKAGGVDYAGCQCEVQDGKVKSVVMSFRELYEGAFAELKTVYENVDKAVEEIKGLRKSESRYDTLVTIHDYVCTHLTYGVVSLEGEDPYRFTNVDMATPMFGGGNGKGKALCGGYARAFQALCVEFDIPCYTITGLVQMFGQDSGDAGHVWNFVQMDNGEWYGVDTTWDDTYYDAFGVEDYTYFLGGENEGYATLFVNQKDTTKNWHLPQPAGPMLSAERMGGTEVTIAWISPQKLAKDRYVPKELV